MDFLIRRKVLISMFFVAMTMLGLVSYNKLQMELYPVPETPSMVVMVGTNIEVDPEYMENQAIIPVEGAIGTLEGVEEISSMANGRNGTIQISYNEKTNLKFAQLRLQEKMNEIASSLPDGFTVTVNRVDTRSTSNQFMSIQVLGEGGEDRLRDVADRQISDKLLNVDGVASVTVYGGREKTVSIELTPEVAEAYRLTPSRIQRLLSSGQVERTYAGDTYLGNTRYYVNMSAEFEDVSDIGNVMVDASTGIRLKDISTISFGTKEETSFSRVNGQDAISITLVNDNTTNLIDLSHRTREVINELNEELESVGVSLIIQSDSAKTMESNIDQIISLAVTGGLLAVLILWFFLSNIQLVLAVALSIPISVYAAFNLFYAFGISINSLTLVGMALAIGMLLDNSVVVLENIYRLAGQGVSIREAVLRGTREVWRSVFAATLTTIAVFLPFFFTSDVVVKLYGRQIGISIVGTLGISFLVAMLLIPMLTYLILHRSENKKSIPAFDKISIRSRLVQIYMLLLKTSLRNPATVVVGGLVIFFIVLFASLATQTNTLETVENNQIKIYVTMPLGTSLDKTDLLVKNMEEKLLEVKEQETVSSDVQEGDAVITINLKEDYEKIDKKDFKAVKSQLSEIARQFENQAEIGFEQSSSSENASLGGGALGQAQRMERMMGMGTNQERIVIKGENFKLMRAVAEDLTYYLDDFDEISRSSMNVPRNQPEVQIRFDKEQMGRNNVMPDNVLTELSAFRREIESGFNFKLDNEEYAIIIRTDTVTELPPMRMTELQQLGVQNNDNVEFELQNLSRITYGSGISRINRVNQVKQIEVTLSYDEEINNDKTLLEGARTKVDELIASMNIPSGIAVQVIHEEDDYSEYYKLIAIAFVLIFMILASVFESFSTPLVLMFSIPLAAIGSLLILLATGNSLLNANTLMGFLILLGVVVNNGIILIDYTNLLKKQGYRQQRALITAGLARLRPILITAITTIVAMLPLALGKSEYVGAIGAPFALTVIGGLAFSTMLTLVFIPTFYSGLQNALQWFRSLPLWLKLSQYAIWVVGGYFVYTSVNSFVWQLADIILLVTALPALVWFMLNSLRKAKETVIPADEPITIRIQNLVKVYGRDNRFVHEWKSSKNLTENSEINNWRRLKVVTWKLPLIAFVAFLAFFHVDSALWKFIFLVVLYFMGIDLLDTFKKWTVQDPDMVSKTWAAKLANMVWKLWYWFAPLAAVLYLYISYRNLVASILIAVSLYILLFIKSIAEKLDREQINVNRLTGRFSKLRRTVYVLVSGIPVIGKKSIPFKALKGVTLQIENGMYGLLGPNGAGKSTLMRILCGIYDQSYGKVWFNDIDASAKREELQGLIGYLPQEFGMYENMSAWDYLQYQSILKKITNKAVRDERVENVLKSVHMWDNRDKKIGSFSGGMKQRVGIAQVLLHLPRVLVVDEPTAGLDPRERIRFRNLFVELSRERIVIFSTHIIEDIASSCNQLAVLRRGEVQYIGSPRNMTVEAQGRVWQLVVPEEEFETFAAQMHVVHHLKEGNNIRLRIIAATQPHPEAVSVEPNLEDAYLWLQKR